MEQVVKPELAAEGKTVKALDSRPELQTYLITIWDAYTSLDRDRQITMSGPGPIPFSSIDRYARRYGIDEIGEFDRFRRMIMAMDAEYLKFVAEQQPKGK